LVNKPKGRNENDGSRKGGGGRKGGVADWKEGGGYRV